MDQKKKKSTFWDYVVWFTFYSVIGWCYEVFLEVNVNAAFGYLGEITGDTASGEIIDAVFERFCLGK